AYRSHYAFIRNPLTDSKGRPVSALNGVVNSFLKIVDQFEPAYIAISFDRKGPTFRHKLAEEYKIQRPPMPDDLVLQIEQIKQFFELIGMKDISVESYEADDVLGTIAVQNQDKYNVVIITGDKDYSQLINDNIKIYDIRKEQIIDRQAVIERYGIKPEQFIDYLAIVGDTADNIPGAYGVGEKTTTPLLQEFDNLDNLYDNLEKIKSKSVKEKLEKSKENVYLSQKLATIVTDVPLDEVGEYSFDFEPANLKQAQAFLQEFDFNYLRERVIKIIRKLDESYTGEEETDTNSFRAVLLDTEESLAKALTGFEGQKVVALDTETDSVEALFANLVGISFCCDLKTSYYVPLSHSFSQNVDKDIAIHMLKKAFADKIIVAHNFKYDYQVLANHGWDIDQDVFDTMLAAYLIDPTRNRLSLESCALKEFSYEMVPIEDLIGKGKKQISFAGVEITQACQYAAEDSWVTYRLYQTYKKELAKKDLSKLFYEIEMPLVTVLAAMEKNGVFIDVPYLNQVSIEVNKQLVSLQEEIFAITEEDFNLNSPQQLGFILFEKLGIKPLKKTKTGFSTDSEVLEKLAEEHEIAKKIINYRQLNKLLGTYIDAFPKLMKSKTQRIHSSFNQTVTTTGRLSSSNPNLQNIPVRTEIGRKMRKAFCTQDRDFVIVAADYSQIELRLMALIAKDENMLKAFQNNEDIHSRTAAIVFHKQLDEVMPDERRRAKIINFGIIYGMGAQALAKELHITVLEAKEFIQDYYDKFPEITNFIESQKEFARQNMYVETIFGRQLPLVNIHSSNPMLKSEAERVAVNMPIQGTAADIIKIAMINLHDRFKDDSKIKMTIQVHDELVFEIDKTCVEEYSTIIKEIMENALPKEYQDKIKLLVDIGVGKNWDEAH
ncbi:MAG: DNA polymerase I, partial [Candidatus Cloacimonetes bacterium]|nr:DNA polymerase I [Candidatus Cloacimonadota bacterium]